MDPKEELQKDMEAQAETLIKRMISSNFSTDYVSSFMHALREETIRLPSSSSKRIYLAMLEYFRDSVSFFIHHYEKVKKSQRRKGKKRKGKQRKAKESKGKQRKEKERKGKENKGKEKKAKQSKTKNRTKQNMKENDKYISELTKMFFSFSFLFLQTALTQQHRFLVATLIELLFQSVSFVEAVDSNGPSSLQESFPFSLFFNQSQEYQDSAIEMLEVLIELCPSLRDWNSYVTCPPSLLPKVQSALSKVQPAEQLPTPSSLSDRFDRFLSSREKAEEDNSLNEGEAATNPALIDAEEARAEMINGTEKFALTSIGQKFRSFKEAQASQDKESIEVARKALMAAYDGLSNFHQKKREKKKRRRNRKIAALNRTTMPPSAAGKLDRNLNLQEEAIQKLEALYTSIAKNTSLFEVVNTSEELCFLNTQACDIIDMSFSAVVAGRINVGKSTVVNCITGENLCPQRITVMTAIPTNYVHDPTVKEPIMVVPFYRQLNHVVHEIEQVR